MFDLIIFDLDGTILDTEELILRSFEYTLKTRLNMEVDRRELLKIFGEPLQKQLEYFEPELADSLSKTYREYYAKHSAAMTKTFPYVTEVLNQLVSKKIFIGVVTNKKHGPAEKGLKDLGLFSKIDFLIASDDVTQSKPHPEGILTGLSKLNIEPHKTLMVGDSPLDIEAANRAHVKSALVGWSIFDDQRFTESPPDFRLDKMTDILKILQDNVA